MSEEKVNVLKINFVFKRNARVSEGACISLEGKRGEKVRHQHLLVYPFEIIN